jgi:hypothetical protein
MADLMKYRADIDAHPVETKKSPFPYISLRRGKAACAKLARMKKRRIKIRPLPPELASAAKRKAFFAGLLRDGDTPRAFSQNNACPALKLNAMRALCRKIANDADGQGRVGVAAALPVRHKKSVGVAAALPVRQQKCGAPEGNRNALRHGAFTAERLAARARIRRIVADADLAIIRALSSLGRDG